MAVFYNKEKSKMGSLTGMIISFPVEITSDDPSSSINKALIPAGYLRCDGRILFAPEYPLLAEVLGVGNECKFRKENQALGLNQIQLPDLRSKNIRATTSSNIGQYNDLFVTTAQDDVIPKAGVGLDVIQNIESPYELTYTGSFYIPPQTLDLRGEPAFSVSTGAYTEFIDVPHTGFQPHMHRTTTTRARQRARGNADFSAFAVNHAKSPSSLNVCQWWENTRQDLCYWNMSSIWLSGKKSAGKFINEPTSYCEQYGGCFNDVCSGFIGTDGFCLWPDDGLCPEVDNKDWCQSKNKDSAPEGPSVCSSGTDYGNINYPPTYTQSCECTFGFFGECIGAAVGKSRNEKNSDQLTNWTEDQGVNLPWTSYDDQYYLTGTPGVQNITSLTGEFGYDGTHRHRMDFNADDPHTYQLKTRAATAQPSGRLSSRITIKVNTSRKADKYIQPYIITEYLIKI
jgi:hypothetical protein